MKYSLVLLCLAESCLFYVLSFKLPSPKKLDFLRTRKSRSVGGDIGCMHMATDEGEYRFRSDGSNGVCGLYLISPPDNIIEMEFTDFDINCDTGILALVDGWEMNNEYFPSPEDHQLSLQERYKTFCNLNRPSKVFVASQNVALIQHLIPQAGSGFTVRVKFVKSAEPCNVVSASEAGFHTLKNFGSRRNCSVSIIYPETISLASVDVGVTSKRAMVEGEFGVSGKCLTADGGDFVEVMGGNSFELNDSGKRRDVVCGMKSNNGVGETVVGCQHSVVRLVSSGHFFNTVTFLYRPPSEEELIKQDTVC